MNDRAIVYRRKYDIPSEWGTAVNVQAMVYRQHRRQLRLRRRVHAQPGQRREGVLRRIPHQRPGRRRRRRRAHARTRRAAARGRCPKPTPNSTNVRETLEKHFKDVQDFEFTIQDGKLFMLQTRNGKRTGRRRAASSPWTWCKEKLIDWKTAIRATRPISSTSCSPRSSTAKAEKAARSSPRACPPVPAPPPARSISTPTAPTPRPRKGEKVLLVRNETSPEDLRGMIAAEGILTAQGRRQLARGARRPPDGQGLRLRRRRARRLTTTAKTVTADGQTFKEGDFLSIDGTAGNVYAGQLKTAPSEIVQVLVEQVARRRKKSETYQDVHASS